MYATRKCNKNNKKPLGHVGLESHSQKVTFVLLISVVEDGTASPFFFFLVVLYFLYD